MSFAPSAATCKEELTFENWYSGNNWSQQNGEIQVDGGDEGGSGRSGRGEDHHHHISYVYEVAQAFDQNFLSVGENYIVYLCSPSEGGRGCNQKLHPGLTLG